MYNFQYTRDGIVTGIPVRRLPFPVSRFRFPVSGSSFIILQSSIDNPKPLVKKTEDFNKSNQLYLHLKLYNTRKLV
jgi:hypothetical protein